MAKKRMKRRVEDDEVASSANAEPRKRQKQYSETDAKLANIFNQLADEVQTERESATKELVTLLDFDDADKVRKVLNRLIRGLCSGRKAARFGFAIALTDILGRLHGSEKSASNDFTTSKILDVIREQTQPEGKVSGQEKRDYALGRLFGYKAVIESQLVKDSDDRSKLLDSIFQLAVYQPWFREECGRTICDYVKQLSSQSEPQKDITSILGCLKLAGLEKTPEGVAIWLAIRSQFPKCDLPSGVWHKNDPLCKKERQSLANILKGGQDVADSSAESTKAENGSKKVKANAPQSTPNFAWNIVLHSMVDKQQELNAKDDKENNTSDYAKFWNEVVDGSLFSAAASPQRKLLGFQVFSKALSICPDWVLGTLFSTNLRRCLINQRKDSERYLHNAAKASLGAIHVRVSSSPDTAAAMVFGLVEEEKGFVNFDRLTQSKTIENILSIASDEALLEVISSFFLNKLIHVDSGEASSADNVRRSLADMLIQLVRNRKEEQLSALVTIKGETWLHKLLDTFVQFAYFTPTSTTKHSSPSPPISEASHSMFQSRLSSYLTHLLSSKTDESIVMPYYVTQRIRKYRKSSSGLESTLQADKQVTKAIKEAQSITDDISIKEAAAEGSQKAVLRAFKLLFCLTIIQAYNGEADAVDLLGELQTCYQSASEGVAAETQAFDMLIEVLLGFVSKQSVLFRKSAEQAFAAFASELTSDSLQSMLDILEKKESLAGQQDLFDQEAEMDGEDDEDEDGDINMDEDASDVEVIDGSEASNVEVISVDGDGSEAVDGDENETDTEEDEEETRFKSLLAEALKTSDAQADGEGSSDDDENMDDDEMMALEPALTKIFKERKKSATGKREKKDAKELIINFKNRVLDLLSIFVKQQYSNPLALDLVLPITRLVRTTTSQQVANKAFELLKHYFDTCKKKQAIPSLSSVDDTTSTLEDVHQEALKGSSSKVHAHACARSSLFLAKVLVTADRTNYAAADKIYADTRTKWFSNQKCSLPVSFFIEWENWSNEMRKQK